MHSAWRYGLNLLIAIDQLATALWAAGPTKRLSSFAYRLEQQGKPWGITRKWIDALFFLAPGHCARAYQAERARAQFPPEFR
jgi:hypothetical protein